MQSFRSNFQAFLHTFSCWHKSCKPNLRYPMSRKKTDPIKLLLCVARHKILHVVCMELDILSKHKDMANSADFNNENNQLTLKKCRQSADFENVDNQLNFYILKVI